MAECEKLVNNEETSCHIATIDAVASNDGLTQDQLGLVTEQVTSLPGTAPLKRKLLHTLIPATSVSAEIIEMLCLWALGDQKLSEDCLVLPALRVTRLCLQYDCVEDKRNLLPLYEVFLSLLGRDKLTAEVAEVLRLLTSSAEVTEWRVRAALRCQSQHGASHALDSLLWTYRQWRPDLVPHCRAPASKVSVGTNIVAKRFHKLWETRLDRNVREAAGANNLWMGGIRVGNVFKKAQRTNLLPSNNILPAGKSRKRKLGEAKNIGDLKTLNELIANIHQIQLPANILSLLGSSGGIQVLTLDSVLVERFSINIYHLLHNEFLLQEDRKISQSEKERRRKRRTSILELLVQVQDRIQQGIPVLGRFLTEYMELWDGKSHLIQILQLISRLQITDFKELHDCILGPLLSRHFRGYRTITRLVVLSKLHELLRTWGAVELERFTKHRRTIFPINTSNCGNAVESLHHLATQIGEMSTLALALARQNAESTHLLTSQVLSQYKVSQLLLLEFNVPVRLDLPTAFLYDALFSHSGDLLSMSCDYILTAKKVVLPALNKELRVQQVEQSYDHITVEVIEEMTSEESKRDLLAATRDFLVFLSPGQVNLTQTSILRQSWELPDGEEALKEGLFIASHPAMLPFAMEYIESLGLGRKERQTAWVELSTEREEDTHTWHTNISIDEGRQKIGANNFYAEPSRHRRSGSKKPVLGNISDFLELLSEYLPRINDLIMEYKKKPASSAAQLPPPAAATQAEDADLRSMISQRTEDSGTESQLTRSRRRRSGHSDTAQDENTEGGSNSRSLKDQPASKIPRRDTRRSRQALSDASNKLQD